MEDKLIVIEENIAVYLEELSLNLEDIEYVKEGGYNFLRIYVESKNGNTSLDDCVKLSSKIDAVIDNIIDEKFFLEVSTPGLDRKLKKEKDFIRFLGNRVNIKTKSNIENTKSFIGDLLDFKENIIYLNDGKLEKEIQIPLEKVKVAKLEYDFSNLLKEED